MSNIIVDLDTITARYEVHKTTIGEWVKKYPEMKKDKNNYDLVECDYAYIQILKERLDNIGIASKLKEAQTENFLLKNKLLKMEIEIKENRYLDYETMAKRITDILIIKRLELQKIPLKIGILAKNKDTYKELQSLIDEITNDFSIDCNDLKVSGDYNREYDTEDKLIWLCESLGILIDKLYSDVLNLPQDKELINDFNDLVHKIKNTL